MADAPRSTMSRIADTKSRLRDDLDLWFASGGGADGPWLVPLSFLHVEDDRGLELLIATDAQTRTGRNVATDGRVRLGLGEVRDLVMIDGTATIAPISELTEAQVERYLAKHRSDPRTWADSLLRIRVHRMQAWREENELTGRTILRDGRWVAD